MNKEGAVSGMIVGMLFMLYYMLKYKFGIFDGGKDAVDGLKEAWWFGISPEGFGTVAMLANFIVAMVVSKFTPAPPEAVQHIVEDIRFQEVLAPLTRIDFKSQSHIYNNSRFCGLNHKCHRTWKKNMNHLK